MWVVVGRVLDTAIGISRTTPKMWQLPITILLIIGELLVRSMLRRLTRRHLMLWRYPVPWILMLWSSSLLCNTIWGQHDFIWIPQVGKVCVVKLIGVE